MRALHVHSEKILGSMANGAPRPPELTPAAFWIWRRWHLWLAAAGLLIRIAYCLTVSKESSFAGWDGKEYFAYAQSLLSLRWDAYPRYFNSIRPPFYPIFLLPFVAINDQVVWPIQLAQSLIGVSQAFILAHIAGRWRGQRAGNWAFVIVLFHPFLIFYCGFVLTETVFIALLWGGIACLQRLNEPQPKNPIRWLTCGGVALALACLTRAPLQLFLPVAALWIGWRALRNSGWSLALKSAAGFTLIVSALLLPVMARNYWVHGEFSLAPGGGPEMFAWGNSPEYLRLNEARTKNEYYEIQDQLTTRLARASSASLGQWEDEVRDFRQNHPRDWWRLQWYKFEHFWTPWLNPLIFSRMNFLLSLLVNTPLFLMAGVELVRRSWQRDSFIILLLGVIAVGYVVGGLLFQVQVRYRIPYVDVAFILLAASLMASLSQRRYLARPARS